MTSMEIDAQIDTAAIQWNALKSLEEREEFLRQYFSQPLQEVDFWEIYRAVRNLKSS